MPPLGGNELDEEAISLTNILTALKQALAPQSSPLKRNCHPDAITITASRDDNQVIIRYTTDGTVPTSDSRFDYDGFDGFFHHHHSR